MQRATPEVFRLVETLLENRIPSIGFLTAFPEAFGLPRTGATNQRGAAENPADLRKKVDLLLNSGSDSRKALSTWRDLEERYFSHHQSAQFAIEDASLALRQTVLIADEDAIEIGDPDETPSSAEEWRAAAEKKLDSIASRVRESAPKGLFDDSSRSSSSSGDPPNTPADQEKQQLLLSHFSKIIYGELKYRQEPYEWVYDGLNPLLLDSVVGSREGIHASLAALYCAVGRRLDCRLFPEMGSQRSGNQAAIEAGLSLAVAPTPEPILLRIDSGSKARSSFYLEPTNGRVINLEESAKLFPTLRQTQPPTPLRFWTNLLRVAMTAHQRRGDGDAVAHCMHQLLALDLSAPEWASALRPAVIRRR